MNHMQHSDIIFLCIMICITIGVITFIFKGQEIYNFIIDKHIKYIKRIPTKYKGFKVGNKVVVTTKYYSRFTARISRFDINSDKEIWSIHFSNGKHYDPWMIIRITKAPLTKDHYPEWF